MLSKLRRLVDWLFRTDPVAPPTPPPPPDPERDKYRASDPSTRDAATRYADPLGDIVDAAIKNVSDEKPAEQLAQDLSGRYGPYTVEWTGSFHTRWQFGFDAGKFVQLDGEILDDSNDTVGLCRRQFYRDDEGRLVVDNDRLELEEYAQRQGFGTALNDELDQYFRRSGVDIVTVHATNIGGYVWARRGFDWDPSPNRLSSALQQVRWRIEKLIADAGTHPDDKLLLRKICDRLGGDEPGKACPTPKELADLKGVDTELGHKVMEKLDWYGIRRLRP